MAYGHSFARRSALLGPIALSIALATIAPARSQSGADSGPTPLTEFRTQMVEAKKTLETLNEKIAASASEIERLTKPDAARKQVEELLGLVAQNLTSVADNGPVAQLGAKALSYARKKQNDIRADTRFSAAERSDLAARWDHNVADLERAVRDLETARTQFVELLKMVQTRSDYAAEVAEAENAAAMVKVIQSLAGELRGTSKTLKGLLRNLSMPDA